MTATDQWVSWKNPNQARPEPDYNGAQTGLSGLVRIRTKMQITGLITVLRGCKQNLHRDVASHTYTIEQERIGVASSISTERSDREAGLRKQQHKWILRHHRIWQRSGWLFSRRRLRERKFFRYWICFAFNAPVRRLKWENGENGREQWQ